MLGRLVIGGTGAELAWNPSTDASDFDYRVSGSPCGSVQVTGDTTHVLIPSSDTDPGCGLVRGSTTTFSVVAVDAFSNVSASSNPLRVTFDPAE